MTPAGALYPYTRSPDADAAAPVRHPVVVVGAGPVGLAAALDLGLRGVPVVLLDDSEGPGAGSRAICFAKRTLEFCDRLGVGAQMLARGVEWNVGKVFRHDRLIYRFDLLPEAGHAFPAFINLGQPVVEALLVEAIGRAVAAGAAIDLRGGHRVTGVAPSSEGVALEIETPSGPHRLEADWLVACDGARSAVRAALGLPFEGRAFEDNFLIADVKMTAEFPTERWFWFAPHFRSGDSALLHKQPDGVWRVDFQLGRDIERAAELDPARIRSRIDRMLGGGVAYELLWTSIYSFQCRRLGRFRHDRVLFAGDSAHQVSPFGARGANSGIQDAQNLAWKLALVLSGDAPAALLDSYDSERVAAADENIRASSRATDFISPHTPAARLFRDAVLDLAEHAPFAQRLVNSGRLSVPAIYDGSPLNGPDDPALPPRTRPGSACPDAPVAGSFLLRRLGPGFTLLTIDAPAGDVAAPVPLDHLALSASGNALLAERYVGRAAAAVYLIRPDAHVAARWTTFDAVAVAAALARALGRPAC